MATLKEVGSISIEGTMSQKVMKDKDDKVLAFTQQ